MSNDLMPDGFNGEINYNDDGTINLNGNTKASITPDRLLPEAANSLRGAHPGRDYPERALLHRLDDAREV